MRQSSDLTPGHLLRAPSLHPHKGNVRPHKPAKDVSKACLGLRIYHPVKRACPQSACKLPGQDMPIQETRLTPAFDTRYRTVPAISSVFPARFAGTLSKRSANILPSSPTGFMLLGTTVFNALSVHFLLRPTVSPQRSCMVW